MLIKSYESPFIGTYNKYSNASSQYCNWWKRWAEEDLQCVKHKRNSPSSKIDVSFKAGNRCLAVETYLELNRDVAFQFNRIARIKYDLNKVQNLIPFQNWSFKYCSVYILQKIYCNTPSILFETTSTYT